MLQCALQTPCAKHRFTEIRSDLTIVLNRINLQKQTVPALLSQLEALIHDACTRQAHRMRDEDQE
jgi:hypothetical protein